MGGAWRALRTLSWSACLALTASCHWGGSLDGFLAEIGSFGSLWAVVAVPAGLIAGMTLVLYLLGWASDASPGFRPLWRVAAPLEEASGLPAWSVAGAMLGLGALLLAGIGFFWDLAWHVDIGRDQFLFSPPHVAILSGLGLLGVAGATAIVYATRDRADVGWRLGGLHVPRAAAALVLLGAGGVVGLFVADLWHHTYGLDVTMWAPAHLLMAAAWGIAPLVLWLILAEAGPPDGPRPLLRFLRAVLPPTVLMGLSAFQLEYDLGVPQFPQLYHPILIGTASGIGLVAARVALGQGGALLAAVGFLALRLATLGLIHGTLGLTPPRCALYVGSALLVELAFLRGEGASPVGQALRAGALVGTLGLASEWWWTQVAGYHPWNAALLPEIAVATAAAVAGAVIGMAIGQVYAYRPLTVPGGTMALAVLTLAGTLLLPWPRTVPPLVADLRTEPAGPHAVWVEVAVSPAGAERGADWFEVFSWQGGGSRITPLVPAGPGRYRSALPVPVGGSWKSLVRFARGREMGGVAVYMPADPTIGASAVPVVPRRRQPMVSDQELLLREAHAGPAWPARVAYTAVGLVAAVWLAVLRSGFVAAGSPRRAPVAPPLFAA